jgi:hypothetical protein
MANKRVLLYDGCKLGNQVRALMHLFVMDDWKVTIVTSPTYRGFGDLLVLCDTGGLDPLVKGAFYPHYNVTPPIPGQDPWMAEFLSHTLDYYVNKKIPIIGLGTTACALYVEAGGKLDYLKGEVEPFYDPQKADFLFPNTEDWSFVTGKFWGIKQCTFDQDFLDSINERYFRNNRGGLQPALVAVAPAPQAPTLVQEESFPIPTVD